MTQRRSSSTKFPRAIRTVVAAQTATIAAGTPRLLDVVGSVETALGENLEGALIRRIEITGVWRPTATGISSLTTGFFRGPSTLDVADLAPAVDPGQSWMSWNVLPTYGQRHLVATTPTLEFDEFRRKAIMRTHLRLKSFGDTVFFVEEVLSQSWEGAYTCEVWHTGS